MNGKFDEGVNFLLFVVINATWKLLGEFREISNVTECCEKCVYINAKTRECRIYRVYIRFLNAKYLSYSNSHVNRFTFHFLSIGQSNNSLAQLFLFQAIISNAFPALKEPGPLMSEAKVRIS
jgi:hypothetical protein